MGGRDPGRFHSGLRLGLRAQSMLLSLFVWVVPGRAGRVTPAPPGWLFWAAVGFAGPGARLTPISRSIRDHRFRGPVSLTILVADLRAAADRAGGRRARESLPTAGKVEAIGRFAPAEKGLKPVSPQAAGTKVKPSKQVQKKPSCN